MDEAEKPPKDDLLRLEYQECVSHSRFIVDIRFRYFVSFTTFFFVLMGAYGYIWVSEKKVFGELKSFLLCALAFFGLMTVVVATMIERRNIHIFRTCNNRAAMLERLMGIEEIGGGIWQLLADPARRRKFLGITVAHTTAISVFYGAVFLVWLMILVFSTSFWVAQIT